MAKNTQVVIIVLLSIIAFALLIIAFKPSPTGEIIQEQEEKYKEKTNEELLKEYLEEEGYEVVDIYFSPTYKTAQVEMISLGSKYLQMLDGIDALIYYYDTPTNSTMYDVYIIQEETTCVYSLLDSVYRKYLKEGETTYIFREMFNEGYCFD